MTDSRNFPSPDQVALIGLSESWTISQFNSASMTLADKFRSTGVHVIASLLDNSPQWAVIDNAAVLAGVVHVPIPLFFSKLQIDYVLHCTQADGLIISSTEAYEWLMSNKFQISILGKGFFLLQRPQTRAVLPEGTSKITFTSGTTGAPKGVCLNQRAMLAVANGVESALAMLNIKRHLSALPFPVLLENVAGLLPAMLHGHTCIALPLAQVGLQGSSQFEPSLLDACIRTYEANSLILLPQMLTSWTHWLQINHLKAPPSLTFVAVGGSSVGRKVIEDARKQGIPAYEGYGLSEGASVQTLNLPEHESSGSAGRPLPHSKVRVTSENEIEISGSLFLGYLGEPATWKQEWFPTGDLGLIDEDGFVHITGRSKNIIITSYGRNISPEWVESVLREEDEIAQAVVLGNNLPYLWAVIWPASGADDKDIEIAIKSANQGLPDYARIGHWIRAKHAFSAEQGMTTANGRPLRSSIETTHSVHATDSNTGATHAVL